MSYDDDYECQNGDRCDQPFCPEHHEVDLWEGQLQHTDGLILLDTCYVTEGM